MTSAIRDLPGLTRRFRQSGTHTGAQRRSGGAAHIRDFWAQPKQDGQSRPWAGRRAALLALYRRRPTSGLDQVPPEQFVQRWQRFVRLALPPVLSDEKAETAQD